MEVPPPSHQPNNRAFVRSINQGAMCSINQATKRSINQGDMCSINLYVWTKPTRLYLFNILHFPNPLLLMPNEKVYFLWAYTCTNALRALSTQKKSKAESNILNISIYYSAIYKITYKKKVSWSKGKSAQRCDITFLNFSPVYFYRSPRYPTIMSRFIHITIFYLYQKRHNMKSSTLWGIEWHFTRAKVPL